MDLDNVSSNDIAPNCDPVCEEGGKTGNTEQCYRSRRDLFILLFTLYLYYYLLLFI